MGQYAENPNQTPATQEVIVYRNPMEKEMWDNYKNGERAFAPLCISAFMAFLFCFVFIKVFGTIIGSSFIKFDGKWRDRTEKLDQLLTITGLVVGFIASFCVFWM